MWPPRAAALFVVVLALCPTDCHMVKIWAKWGEHLGRRPAPAPSFLRFHPSFFPPSFLCLGIIRLLLVFFFTLMVFGVTTQITDTATLNNPNFQRGTAGCRRSWFVGPHERECESMMRCRSGHSTRSIFFLLSLSLSPSLSLSLSLSPD